MKLLFFSFEMLPLISDNQEMIGGVAVQWNSWIRGFKENGHEFALLTSTGAKKNLNTKVDFDIIECYNPNYGIRKLRFFYYQLPNIYKKLKYYRPDYLIQTTASKHTFIFMVIAKFLRIPFIHRLASDVHVDERIYTLVHKKKDVFLYRLGVKYSDFLFAQNSYQFKKLKEKYPKKNIFILHNPYELKTKETDILPRTNRKYIAWIGNFRPIKNIPALFDIAQKLPEINFKIAGIEFPDLDKETKQSILNLKRLNNVEFIGYLNRDKINTFLSASIALLNTSFTEGFSNTFLEAWSLGVPVVTTKNVNPDDIVGKYNLGKVAENYDHLSSSLECILNMDEVEYNRLALHCFNYVKENHNPKLLANKFVSYLNSVN